MLRKTTCLGGLSLILASCGGGGNGSSTPVLSSGLKIFVTANKHIGDFKNDPLLQGTTAVSKADSFCNNDPNKPNNSSYKALIVDSVNRSPINNNDWVFKPNTTYYRSYNNIKIGDTINSAIFPVFFADLTNSVSDIDNSSGSDPLILPNTVWTGIYDATFAPTSTSENCADWSFNSHGAASGLTGTINMKNRQSFSNIGTVGCDFKASLYCVEQP